MWQTLVFGPTAALFAAMTCGALYHLRWVRRLPAMAALEAARTPDEATDAIVKCSVVIAARDEAARIEQTVRRVLAQRDVILDLVVVDDRSTDHTGEILRRLALDDTRLRVERIDALPDGWLGKCHACHTGAAAATGKWILFTDADCWLSPDVIARALRVACRENADHIVLTAGIAGATLAARAWHLAMLASLANWFARVNVDRPNAYLGMGSFNLVRASAYRNSGGYEALRLTIVDDVRLGLLLHRSGARTRAFIGANDTECQWGTTVPAMIKILEKNYFALMNFRLGMALTAGLGGIMIWALAIIGPFTGTIAGMAAGLALLSLMIPAMLMSRRLGWSLNAAVIAPFIYPAMFYAILNSALLTVRNGGVRWRDTFYSLEALRKGDYAPPAR